MPPNVLLICLAFRSLSLLLPHTYFQPDEFYQALEPAYDAVFGSGYLTWEWRDLPSQGTATWWDRVVVGGRLRGWIWPGVFALVYSSLKGLGVEDSLITIAPRIVGVVIAAYTDYYTYLLAGKVLSPRSASTALLLSMTSLFNGHLLPRALSTSPETLLTVAAVYYYPLDSTRRSTGTVQPTKTEKLSDGRVYNYSAMDRCEAEPRAPSSLTVAAALAALSISIRPTMLVFWSYLHLEQTVAQLRSKGVPAVFDLWLRTLIAGSSMLVAAAAVDWSMVGRPTLPVLSFFHRNVVLDIASFYGTTGLLYHITQSLPLLLFPIWYWWAKGYLAALIPDKWLHISLSNQDIPQALRTIARCIMFTICALSLSPHSEWRFLHPLLPLLLLFAIPALQPQYAPSMIGCDSLLKAFRQYFRLELKTFYFILLAPVIPYLYLNIYHGAAQVSVINNLRAGAYGDVRSVAVFMPCHSTPWASHLGSIRGWFLTCEPPLHNEANHWTQQTLFYSSPVSYFGQVFPYPPLPLSDVSTDRSTAEMPSHLLLFGCLLDVADANASVRDVLKARGYDQIDNIWNGFDFAQDEEKRRGGVRVWVQRRGPQDDDIRW